ncbi:MAG TPA: hypothetical protein VGF47_02380 [Solirubrobacteraceae bacterium]
MGRFAAAARTDTDVGADAPDQPGRWRRKRVLLIALGVIVFLVISALIARFLTSDNLEREDDVALIEAEAKGDAQSMIDKLSGCRENPSCVALQRKNASDPRLHRAGTVKILQLTSATANSPTGATGKTRLAWTVLGRPPIVQCIDVRRTGNALTGVNVELLSLSGPINNEADC